jgi:TATA-box binding protein (TBP) (component of TFIID and TFIIIB)
MPGADPPVGLGDGHGLGLEADGSIRHSEDHQMDLLPSNIKIATMTMHAKFDETEIFFDEVMARVLPCNDDIVQIEYCGSIKSTPESSVKKRPKLKSTFHNSMSVYVSGGSKLLHINLFRNGTMHITGSKMMAQAEIAIAKLTQRLRDAPLTYSGELRRGKISISMINSNISLDFTLNKKLLRRYLDEAGVECVFNKTQNITLKHDVKDTGNQVIIIVHKQSIILSRCKCVKDIMGAYSFVMELLQRLKPLIVDIGVDQVLQENIVLKSFIL